jgi:DNA-binding transcriptional MerR regulator
LEMADEATEYYLKGKEQPHEAGEFLSDAQVCAILRVTPRTTARWRVEGSGPPFIRAGGRRLLYRRADLDLWLSCRTFAHRAAEVVQAAAKCSKAEQQATPQHRRPEGRKAA